MQAGGMLGKPSPGVVFDCDLGNHIDDILALALLYGFDTRNEIRVTSVSVCKANLKSAALCDAIMRFYASGGTGQAPMFSRTLPVGFAEDGKTPEDTRILTELLSRRDGAGKPVFPHGIDHVNDTAECSALIRNALTAQYDQNAIVVATGPLTNLAKVLGVAGAKELIEKKAKFLVLSCGEFPAGDPEFNIATDVAAAKKVLAEWPGPVVMCGREIAEALRYPASSIEKDYSYAAAHPVAEAYKAFKPMPYDAPGGDLAAVLFAVRPQETFFRLSDPGVARIRDDGGTEFTPSANGRHRHLILNAEHRDRVVKVFTEVASAKPVVRRPRFFQQDQQVKPPDPPKSPAVKPSF